MTWAMACWIILSALLEYQANVYFRSVSVSQPVKPEERHEINRMGGKRRRLQLV